MNKRQWQKKLDKASNDHNEAMKYVCTEINLPSGAVLRTRPSGHYPDSQIELYVMIGDKNVQITDTATLTADDFEAISRFKRCLERWHGGDGDHLPIQADVDRR